MKEKIEVSLISFFKAFMNRNVMRFLITICFALTIENKLEFICRKIVFVQLFYLLLL